MEQLHPIVYVLLSAAAHHCLATSCHLKDVGNQRRRKKRGTHGLSAYISNKGGSSFCHLPGSDRADCTQLFHFQCGVNFARVSLPLLKFNWTFLPSVHYLSLRKQRRKYLAAVCVCMCMCQFKSKQPLRSLQCAATEGVNSPLIKQFVETKTGEPKELFYFHSILPLRSREWGGKFQGYERWHNCTLKKWVFLMLYDLKREGTRTTLV